MSPFIYLRSHLLSRALSLWLVLILFGCNTAPFVSGDPLEETIEVPNETQNQPLLAPAVTETHPATPSHISTEAPTPTIVDKPAPTISSTRETERLDEDWVIAYTAIIIDDPLDPGRQNHDEIYTIQLHSRQPERLVESMISSWCPKWSPDGKKIAFISFEKVVPSLFILDTETGQTVDEIENVWEFDWSVDGQAIAYCEAGNWPFEQEKPYNCFLARIDDLTQPQLLLSADWHTKELLWSPMGDQILLLAERQVGEDTIYLIDLDGQTKEILTDKRIWTYVTWHPNGQRIIYEVHPESFMDSSELQEIDLNSMEERVLTNSSTITSYPQWSPDGQFLAYVGMPVIDPQKPYLAEEDPQVGTIYILSSSTGKIIKIPGDHIDMFFPIWSPNGKYLAFIQPSGKSAEAVLVEGYSLKVYELETGKITTLLSKGVQRLAPSWKPHP